MPAGDGHGPYGQGPRTGRAAGFCGGQSTPGYVSGEGRGGWAGGRAGSSASHGRHGHRHRHCFHATGLTGWQRREWAPTESEEHQALQQQAERLEETLEAVRKRLQELEARKDD